MEEGQKIYVMSYLGRPIDENLIFNGVTKFMNQKIILIYLEKMNQSNLMKMVIM